MILGIKTSDLVAELVLYDETEIARDDWQTNRDMARGLLERIELLLEKNNASWNQLSGLIVYKGPGSFTSLRIGLTTANSIVYSLAIPIVGSSGDDWITDGIVRLRNNENDTSVFPEYGAEPRITSPRK
ncbi:MAG: tRNA (adenosine(37)-N6)-threonylcarbamoyltransferase complex dimerization subunit type 1 TsaB [Candidatus Saccharimonadales bacterium]